MLGLDEAAAFFGGSMIRDPKAFGSGKGKIFTPYVQQSIADSSRLQELKGRTEIMPSMAARGEWKLGAIGCWGASWSDQLDGKWRGFPFSGQRLHVLHCGMLNL